MDLTPKCHPKIADEGIEYLWALAKLWYWKAPLVKKRSKESFRKLVVEATDGKTVLNVARARSCSKKARAYMKLYVAMRAITVSSSDDSPEISNKYAIMEAAMKKYFKLKKKGKTHRSVLDRHRADLDEIERLNSLPLPSNNEKHHIKEEMIGKSLVKMCAM